MPAAPHPSCPFCDVIRGAGEVSMCYEDKDVVAFMDIQPVNAGHVLVVPREHFESLEDIPHALVTHLVDVAMQLAPVVKHVGGADGMNIVVNSGAAAGQDVFHFHVHVIPRSQDDGFGIPLPFAGSSMPDRTVLDANAARIIAALRDPVALRPDRRTANEERRASSS
jgi:histidine triad (HIT) family protein